MAYTALYGGEEKGAFEVPSKTDAYCLECGEAVRVWREASDGTARHFKHITNMGGGDGGNGSHCSGGEGDKHKKWKNFAAERLQEAFENAAEVTVEKRLAAPYTDKEYRDGDAVVMFSERDEQLGSGLVVEVQHKNRDKDIESTTRDYLKQDLAVAWLDQDDFWEKGCRLAEVDFRDRAGQIPTPLFFKDVEVNEPFWQRAKYDANVQLCQVRKARETLNNDNCEYELEKRQFAVPAKIPREYYDDKSIEIWRSQQWSNIVESVSVGLPPFTDRDVWHAEEYIRDAHELSTEVPATLPEQCVAEYGRRYWEDAEWNALFQPPQTPNYILQGAVKNPSHKSIEATLPADQIKYRSYDWENLFTAGPRPDYSDIGDEPGTITADVPINAWISEGRPPLQIQKAVKNAYDKGRNHSNISDSDRRTAISRVPNIIRQNTGGKQPDAASQRTILTVASANANLNPTAVRWALERLISHGDIQKTSNNRYKLTNPV